MALAIERVNAATTLGLRSVRSAWAGLRTFAPDRNPVVGPDPAEPSFVWLAGQGGYGIQTAPALARLAAGLLPAGVSGPKSPFLKKVFDLIRFPNLAIMALCQVLVQACLLSPELPVRQILATERFYLMLLATTQLGTAILAESTLSFLGYGVPPPFPTWGAMLSGTGRAFMLQSPWLSIWPGLAISAAVFGFNMLGDALRDELDPRLRGR